MRTEVQEVSYLGFVSMDIHVSHDDQEWLRVTSLVKLQCSLVDTLVGDILQPQIA